MELMGQNLGTMRREALIFSDVPQTKLRERGVKKRLQHVPGQTQLPTCADPPSGVLIGLQLPELSMGHTISPSPLVHCHPQHQLPHNHPLGHPPSRSWDEKSVMSTVAHSASSQPTWESWPNLEAVRTCVCEHGCANTCGGGEASV